MYLQSQEYVENGGPSLALCVQSEQPSLSLSGSGIYYTPRFEYPRQSTRLPSNITHIQAGYKTDAIESCQKVLDMEPNSADALCDLADLYVSEQDYEQGIKVA